MILAIVDSCRTPLTCGSRCADLQVGLTTSSSLMSAVQLRPSDISSICRSKAGGGPLDHAVLREIRAILPDHLAYIGTLLSKHDWLASDQLSYADLAAAANLSVAEHLGDMPWPQDGTAQRWYARIQSRPSFQSMITAASRGFVRQRN